MKLWKLHTNLLVENRVTKSINGRKVTKASNLKKGQLVFVKNHHKGPFYPTYTFGHRILATVNESAVVLTIQDGKMNRCNIHHINPVSVAESSISAYQQFNMVSAKTPSTHSQVTNIIFMQEITNCNTTPYTRVRKYKLSNFISGIN